MEMRKFTLSDYNAYSGVESEYPLIGETDNLLCIVDGACMQTWHTNEPLGELGEEIFVTVYFASESIALLVAMDLRGDETPEEIQSIDLLEDINLGRT
jgi:hypothetical protein